MKWLHASTLGVLLPALLGMFVSGQENAPAASELTPDELVQAVLARNPSLAAMAAAREAAAARYPQVTSLDDPMFSATIAPLSIGRNDVDFGGQLEVSQKLPGCGKRSLRGQAAQAEAGAAEQDLADAKLQLVLSVRNAFADYFLVHRALAVNEEGLQLLANVRAVAKSRYETGQVTQRDFLQAEVELGKQRQRRLTLERMRKVAQARINTLMHEAPDASLPPPPARLPAPEPLPALETLLATARAERPDLRALAERIAAEEAALALAHKEFTPDVEATAAYDSMMGNGPTRPVAAQIGFRVNLPVRTARREGAVREAEAKVAQRRAELAAKIDEVNFQVQEAYEQALESEQILQEFESSLLPAARESVRTAQSAYSTGALPFVELLEAERSLLEQEDRFSEARADGYRRRAVLERVVAEPASPPD